MALPPRRQRAGRRWAGLGHRAPANRGAGTLLGVVAVMALTGLALAAVAAQQSAAQKKAVERADGLLMGSWLLAAHRAATLEFDYGPALAINPSFTVPAANLRALGAADPGLPAAPRGGTLTLGVMLDGTPRNVPMAFAVLEPATLAAVPSMRLGALAAGLEQVAEVGGPGTEMDVRRPAIEAALGRVLTAGALYATADHAVPYLAGAVHRGPQPGRPDLNRMAAALDMDLNDIENIGRLEAGELAVTGALRLPTAPVPPATGLLEVGGTMTAAEAEVGLPGTPGTLTAAAVDAGTGALGPVTAGQVAIAGALTPAAVTVAGHMGMNAASTVGSLNAAVLAATAASVATAISASEFYSEEVGLGAGAFIVAGGATLGGVNGMTGNFNSIAVGACIGCEYLPPGVIPP